MNTIALHNKITMFSVLALTFSLYIFIYLFIYCSCNVKGRDTLSLLLSSHEIKVQKLLRAIQNILPCMEEENNFIVVQFPKPLLKSNTSHSIAHPFSALY